MIGSASRKLLASARKMGPPVTLVWIADARRLFGDGVADPVAAVRAEWESAVDARDAVRVLAAERELCRLLSILVVSILATANPVKEVA